MAEFKITNGPSAAKTPGRWRLVEPFPAGVWRVKLLEMAQQSSEGRELALEFEGGTLTFSSPTDREELRMRMRLINDLVKRANEGAET